MFISHPIISIIRSFTAGLVAIVMFTAILAGCAKDETDRVSEMQREAEVEFERTQSAVEMSLQEAEMRLAELERKVSRAEGESRQELTAAIDDIRQETMELRSEIAELKNQSQTDSRYSEQVLKSRVDQLESTIREARLNTAETTEELSDIVRTQLDEANAVVDSLEVMATEVEGRVEYSAETEVLMETRTQRDSLEAYYERLATATDEEFEELRSEIALVSSSLERSLNRAVTEIDQADEDRN